MGLNKGKYYDAKLTRQLCDGMSESSVKYKEFADDTHRAYDDFDKNELFHGTAATALKTFMVGGTGKILTEITDIHKQMVEDQTLLISSFEAMVDPSPTARIEYDTLDIINTDFKGYSNTFTGIASDVDSIVSSLNAEFCSYDHFPKPDSKSAINGFATMCGGEGSGGFIKECQNKLISFDSEVTTYLKGRDTKDRAIEIGDRVLASKATMSTGTPSLAKTPMVTVTKNETFMNCAAIPAAMAPGAVALTQEYGMYLSSIDADSATIEYILGLLGLTAVDGPLPFAEILVLLILCGIAAQHLYDAAKEFFETQKRIQEIQKQSEAGAQSETEEKTGESDGETENGEDAGGNERETDKEFDLDKLSRSQRKAVESAENIINDHLKESDLEAAKGDLEGKPIPKQDGGYWNHEQEVRDAYKGLNRAKDTLEGSLRNPNLEPEVQDYLQKELDKANDYLNMIEDIFEPYGGIE